MIHQILRYVVYAVAFPLSFGSTLDAYLRTLYFFLEQTIHLKGEKYLLKGQINFVSESVQLPDNILVDIVGSNGNVIDSTTAKRTPNVDGQKTSATFEYTVWANVGDKITFIPRDSRFI